MKWRGETLKKIKTAIEVDIGVTKIKRSEDLWRSIAEWFAWQFQCKIFDVVFGTTKTAAKAGYVLVQLAMSKVIPVKYNYGVCSICLEDDANDSEPQRKWILTSCCHRFHRNCIESNQAKLGPSCPLCKGAIGDLIDLP